ncbi:MAG: AraC family transcriptional regulator [Clostridia bacterium]
MKFFSPYCSSGHPFFNPISNRLVDNPHYQFCISRSVRRGSNAFEDTPVHWHDFIQIWYTVEGHYKHRLFNDVLDMGPGSLIVVPPFYTHEPFCVEDGPLDVICCDCSLEFLRTLFGEQSPELALLKPLIFADSGTSCLQLNADEASFFSKLLAELYDEYIANSSKCIVVHKREISYLFEFILNRQIRPMKLARDEFISKYYDAMNRVITHINLHYNERLYINDVCKLAYMSCSHFSLIFKEITGNTFAEYVAIVRLLNAAYSLTMTDKPILEIAYEHGFHNKTHFYQQFNFYMGHTPREHRKMTQQSSLSPGADFNSPKT